MTRESSSHACKHSVKQVSMSCPLRLAGPIGYRLFTRDDVFTVPWGKYNIRVLIVGGGGGGGCGHTGGGGSGYVVSTTLAVTPGTTFPIRVGKGGSGAARNSGCDRGFDVCNELFGNDDGGESSFGYTKAAGGKTPRHRFVGGDGGSGGGGGGGAGAGCDPQGSIGGFDGSDGANCKLAYYTTDYTAPKGGVGQGKGAFSSQFSIFRNMLVTSGEAGMRGSNEIWMAGSGGGGVKVSSTGPSGIKGAGLSGGYGGVGYGGGGGAGGFTVKWADREAGGSGADGVVYVEWD
jgi:hypothetical protein